MTTPAVPPPDVAELQRALRSLLDWVHAEQVTSDHPVTALVRGHLGDAADRSVVGQQLAPFEHVNLQVALEAWLDEPGRTVVVQGLAMPPHFGGLSLHQLTHGLGLPPVNLSAPDLTDLADGPSSTRGCWQLVLLLVEDARGRSVLLLRGPSESEGGLSVEVGGLLTPDAQAVLRELTELRHRHNVYRGQLLELQQGQSGPRLVFVSLPTTEREDVVLPEHVLRRVERHALDIAQHRDRLRAAGRHLKRGLLLYGPPGTGKTHTTRYLVQHLPGTTVLLVSGRSLHLITQVTELARALEPSAVVLEDVDLIAEDRGFGPGPSPVLFELLDAMDGSASDADLLFLLTTNRADLLEPALAARPGRVDVAVEIGLPDEDARRRLLEVHGRGLQLDLSSDDVANAVDRTEGVTASFIKELLRRAALEAITRGAPDGTVSAADLVTALDDLLDTSQGVTRALLGVPADQSAAPDGGPLPPAGPGFLPGGGFRRGMRSAAYTSTVTFGDAHY